MPPGGMAQVREVAGALIRASKERGMATLLVGHVTKDGAIAGPRLLEHLVDVVLHFEGDRHARLRLVRGVKNRYGATDEVGCFELHDEGITGLADPSGLFLTRRAEPVPGTCLTVTLEGRRPLVAEVQALTVDSQIPSPRRTTSGLETSRVSMMLAVLEQRGRISALGKRDIYSATVGGVKLSEPAADLAIALALASAASDTPLPKNLVAIGEVGLAGEVRRVTGVQRRLAEAARLGFTHALVPGDPGKVPAGMRVLEVADIGDALRVLPGRPRREERGRRPGPGPRAAREGGLRARPLRTVGTAPSLSGRAPVDFPLVPPARRCTPTRHDEIHRGALDIWAARGTVDLATGGVQWQPTTGHRAPARPGVAPGSTG
ncbi:hypothetical protein GCM10020000_36210 [Streptomyces olivoverticillatus]